MSVTQPCLTLCDPMDDSLPGSLVQGVLQARILKWVAIPFSRESFPPRDQTWASCIAGRFFIIWASREGAVIINMSVFLNIYAQSLSHSWLFGIPWTAAHQGLHLPLVTGDIYWPQAISWSGLWNCSKDTFSQKFNLIFSDKKKNPSAKAAVWSWIPGSGRWPGEGNGNLL